MNARDLEALAVRVSDTERETLTAWRDCEVGYGFGFEKAASLCDTPRHSIRRAVRSLARKGLLEYARALYWEDEPKIGAGYTLTQAGSDYLRTILCHVCNEGPVVTELDGELLCQAHADAWVRSEGIFAAVRP